MRFSKKVFITVFIRISALLIGLVATSITTHYLKGEGRGIFSVLQTIVLFGFHFGELGYTYGNLYFAGLYPKRIPQILINGFYHSIFIGLIIVALVQGVFKICPTYFKGIDNSLLFIYSMIIIPLMLFNFIQYIFVGNQETYKFPLMDIFLKVMLLFVAFFSFVIFDGYIKLYSIVALFSHIALVIFLFIWQYKEKTLSKLKFKPDFKLFKDMRNYGIKSYIILFLSITTMRVNIFIMNYFLGNETTGYYGLAVQVSEWALFIPVNIGILLFGKKVRENLDKRYVFKVLGITGIVTIAICIAGVFLSKPLFPLIFGNEFSKSYLPFVYLLPSVVFGGLYHVLHGFYSGSGLPKFFPILWIFVFIINVTLSYILIPQYKMIGGAISITISYTVLSITLIMFLLFKKDLNIKETENSE